MAFEAKILVDSVNHGGVRLTTWELTYPRFIHSELMTHRVFSRNAASSRAIPIEKMIERIQDDPVYPVFWGRNTQGMQAREELDFCEIVRAKCEWDNAREYAIETAREMDRIGVHKQITNRLLEPFSWITTLVTATEWENFYNLRLHKDAQPEFQHLTRMMRDEFKRNRPKLLKVGEWHRPLMPDLEEILELGADNDTLNRISAGRCARVSYLTHTGERNITKDILLSEILLKKGHMSPFEHIAESGAGDWFYGNLRGWIPLRKRLPGEAVWRENR